jgi:hypothetical protein
MIRNETEKLRPSAILDTTCECARNQTTRITLSSDVGETFIPLAGPNTRASSNSTAVIPRIRISSRVAVCCQSTYEIN